MAWWGAAVSPIRAPRPLRAHQPGAGRARGPDGARRHGDGPRVRRAGAVISMARGREPLVLVAVGAVLLAVSAIHPYDPTTWLLEVAPILIGVPLLLATARRFPLTPLVYR